MSLYYNNKGKLDGLPAVYVDDTPVPGLKTFQKRTDMIPTQFESTPKEYPPMLFAGINNNSTPEGFFLEENSYISQIGTLKQVTNFDAFRATRHRL